jgi:hypothetical protein
MISDRTIKPETQQIQMKYIRLKIPVSAPHCGLAFDRHIQSRSGIHRAIWISDPDKDRLTSGKSALDIIRPRMVRRVAITIPRAGDLWKQKTMPLKNDHAMLRILSLTPGE